MFSTSLRFGLGFGVILRRFRVLGVYGSVQQHVSFVAPCSPEAAYIL